MVNDGKDIDYGSASFHIDERLQEVLGHCRFYFQEVPLPNCHGVRFGKYGSFLADCQHSPCNSPIQANSQHILSYNKSNSPQTVSSDNHGTARPRGLKLLPRENGLESTTITSRAEGNSSRHDLSRKGSATCSADQYNHTVPNKRIKLDRETLTTPKNQNLYQSLGIDMSSSSTDGDSPQHEHYLKGSELRQPSSNTNIIEMMQSSRDICHRWDSAEKRDSKNPVCPNFPVKHFNPEPSAMPTTLMETGNMTNKDTKYRSAGEIEEMVTAFPKRRGKSVPRLDDTCDSHLGSKSTGPVKNQYSPNIWKSSQDKFYGCNDMPLASPVKLQRLTDEANKPIREADYLNHSANILKSSGLQIESTELFFQAALKYLDAASLLETHVLGSSKNVELTPFKIYDATSKLLEYCAQEYERCKDMGCAALAYKCLEASNMRIVYTTDKYVRRDCQELQVSLQSLTSGITPVINIKNKKYTETADVPKDSTYPQPAESYPLDSRSRSMFVQLLNFTQYANSAMDASRKSQITFSYASKILEETGSTRIVDCIKRALNYGFHDMKKLLYLVYEAIEALSS